MFLGSLQATRAMCTTPSVMVIGTRAPSGCAFPREERCCTGITCVQKRLPILITNLENKTEHSQHPEIHSTRKRIAIDTANTTECLPRARRRSPTIAHCQEWFSALVRRHCSLDFCSSESMCPRKRLRHFWCAHCKKSGMYTSFSVFHDFVKKSLKTY